MKRPPFKKALFPLIAAFGFLLPGVNTTFAQMPGTAGGTHAMTAVMVKLFGTNNAFTSRAEFRVLNAAQKETDNMPVGFAFLEGDIRMDVDMNQVKSTELPPAQISSLKQMGMDQTVIVIRPAKKTILSIYPRAKAYAEIALTKEEETAMNYNYKVEKTPQGRETVDGFVCEKSTTVFTGEKGEKHEVVVWNASTLKNFPYQIKMTDQGATVIVKFKDLKLVKPDARQFEAPAGMTKYNTAEALLEVLTKPAVKK